MSSVRAGAPPLASVVSEVHKTELKERIERRERLKLAPRTMAKQEERVEKYGGFKTRNI